MIIKINQNVNRTSVCQRTVLTIRKSATQNVLSTAVTTEI
uniref:Uncharacterized protein n=1 Tax=Anguilla anguilla TaxID=7936 RepID=A0A0E9WN95_ANGAN